MYDLKIKEKQMNKAKADYDRTIQDLKDQNHELQNLLDEYEHDIDTFNSKIEEKDEQIDTLKEQNEVLKEKSESFNLEHKQKLELQAKQNEIYIRDLKEQIKGLEQHLSEDKLAGDAKHKELEDELARMKKEYFTKFDLKQ